MTTAMTIGEMLNQIWKLELVAISVQVRLGQAGERVGGAHNLLYCFR